MTREAVAVRPDGNISYAGLSYSQTIDFVADDVANHDQPAGTQVFRIPRRMEKIIFPLPSGTIFDRLCPICGCGMRFHGNSGPCERDQT